MSTCKKCHKLTINEGLCNDCKRNEEQKKSLNLKATKLLNTLTHGEYHNYIVNQSKTFGTEFFYEFIWAPIQFEGRTYHHWSRVSDLKIGDKIFNSRNGKIEGISIVTKEAVIKNFPEKTNDPKYNEEGWYVECKSRRLSKPLDLNNYIEERKKLGQYNNSPFDKNGDFCKGYLFPLNDELTDIFENDIQKYKY